MRSATASCRGIPAETTLRRRGVSRNDRHGEDDARADAVRALDADRAAVRLDERLDDGESDPGAARGARGFGRAVVRLEDPRERLRGNPRALVLDLDLHRAAAGCAPCPN